MHPFFYRLIRPAAWLGLLLALFIPGAARAQFIFVTNNGAITITGYSDTGAANVVIPNTTNNFKVTAIGSFAFDQVDSITSVTVGTNVGIIGTNAFFQCSRLISVTLSNSITNFGDGPFYDCQALTTFNTGFSNSLYMVTNGAIFSRALTFIVQYPCGLGGAYTIPANVTNVGEAFVGNTLSSIAVNTANTFYTGTNGVLFNKNKSVLIDYPGSLSGTYVVPTNAITTVINSAAFEFSPAVNAVVIGTNITTIGYAALYDCASLTSITVATNNAFYTTTNGVLFNKGKTTLIQYPAGIAGSSYTVPATVLNITDGAFGDAFHLRSVILPNTVTNLGYEAFYACENLSAIYLGTGMKVIGQDAFFLCTNLSAITFPSSMTSIGNEAFGACFALQNACFEGKPPTDGGSIFAFDYLLTSILYVTGNTGWGSTYDGITTAPCAMCGAAVPTGPILSIARSGTNVLVKWDSSFTGYTLEYSTNLRSAAAWVTNVPAAVVISTQYVATNSIRASTNRFYRLIQ